MKKDLKQDNRSETLFDKKAEHNRRWFELLTSNYYSVIKEYWDGQLAILAATNKQLAREQTQNNLLKIGGNLACENMINAFFNRVESKKRELVNKKGGSK